MGTLDSGKIWARGSRLTSSVRRDVESKYSWCGPHEWYLMSLLFLPQSHDSYLRKTSDKPKILQNILPPQIVSMIKIKESLRNWQRPEKAMAPHSSTLAWRIPWMEEPARLQSTGLLGVGHDWATSLSLFIFHALEKEMAKHSSVLARRIPGTAEPGGLPSMGSPRVGHDWSDLAAAAAEKPKETWCLSGIKSPGWDPATDKGQLS